MLCPVPGIPETGFLGHGLASGVVGVPTYGGVNHPMGNQSELTCQGFPIRHGLIPDIRMVMTPNEPRQVARPDIVLTQVRRWCDAKGLGVNLGLGWGLVVAAHRWVLETGRLR